VEHQGRGGDLDISGGWQAGEHTGGDTVRKTVLVHLLSKSLDLSILLGVWWSLVAGNRAVLAISLTLLQARSGRLLGLALSGSLGIAGSLGSGNHLGMSNVL
jgi:hypothetical protein